MKAFHLTLTYSTVLARYIEQALMLCCFEIVSILNTCGSTIWNFRSNALFRANWI